MNLDTKSGLKIKSGLRRLALFGLVGIALSSDSVFGLGFRIPNLDAEATARGNAFVATADNPSALYYNPAGITQLKGAQAELDFHAITLDSHFKGAGGQDSHSKPELQGVPQLYCVFTPTDKPYSFGFGMYAP